MEDWLVLSLLSIIGVLGYGLGAAGSAALVFRWFPRLSRTSSALASSLPAPIVLIFAFLLIVAAEGDRSEAEAILAFAVVVVLPGIAVGWPSGFLTLRALERRVERAGIKASEIFE